MLQVLHNFLLRIKDRACWLVCTLAAKTDNLLRWLGCINYWQELKRFKVNLFVVLQQQGYKINWIEVPSCYIKETKRTTILVFYGVECGGWIASSQSMRSWGMAADFVDLLQIWILKEFFVIRWWWMCIPNTWFFTCLWGSPISICRVPMYSMDMDLTSVYILLICHSDDPNSKLYSAKVLQ